MLPMAKARKVTSENYQWYLERWGGHPLSLKHIETMEGVIVEHATGGWILYGKKDFEFLYKRASTEEIQGWYSVRMKTEDEKMFDAMVDIAREHIGTRIADDIAEAMGSAELVVLGPVECAYNVTEKILAHIAEFVRKGR